MNPPDRELRRLTDAWHDGTITPEEAIHLEQRLAEDGPAREYLFDIAAIEAAMPEAMAGRKPEGIAVPRRPQGWWWRIAASFVAGAFVGPLLWKTATPSPPAIVRDASPAATVTGMFGVSWDNHPDGGSLTLAAGAGETRIGSGLVELTFASGVRTVIEGPAAFQVLGGNAMNLTLGRLVADVPKGAEGFTIHYPDGRLVDLGTEFGVEVLPGGRSANFGVFRGEVELHPQGDAARPVLLRENHAVVAEDGRIVSVPFAREKFTRKLPSREFAWEVPAAATGPLVWDYDVSHLVWKPGRYRAICKWMSGVHGIILRRAELLLDGKRVAEDTHEGFTGIVNLAQANAYELIVSPEAYRRGRWTLRLHVQADIVPDKPEESAGVVLVEEGLAWNAQPSDFIGTWEYLHDGQVFRRSFAADGSASLSIDGQSYEVYHDSRWRVESGLLILEIREEKRWIREEHLLRDADTLIFTNRPYRNARRIAD